MVKEEFGKKTQVLGIDLGLVPVDLEHGMLSFSVDFISGRMFQSAPCLGKMKRA